VDGNWRTIAKGSEGQDGRSVRSEPHVWLVWE
jgi:hypothetical protein